MTLIYGDGGAAGRCVGFVVELRERFGPVLAVLKDLHEPHPRLFEPGSDGRCLSLGAEWLLEPLADEWSFPGAMRPRTQAGVLAFDGDAWWIQVATSGIDALGRFNTEWCNVATGEGSRQIANWSVTFARWQVWQSEEDRTDQRGNPVLVYEAVAVR